MYPNYNYYPNQTQQPSIQSPYNVPYPRQAPPQITLKGRLVSSLEEAKASPIDFDGSIFYFPDLANKRIYTKQINMDGTATLNTYELTIMPAEQPQSASRPSMDNFVTKEELEKVLAKFKESLSQPQTTQKEILSF